MPPLGARKKRHEKMRSFRLTCSRLDCKANDVDLARARGSQSRLHVGLYTRDSHVLSHP